MNRLSTAAVACALAISASASMAASQSSASITGLTFTLIDLNPRDGIASSFSFLTSTGSTVLSVSANDNALGEIETASRTRAGTFTFSNQFLAELTNASAKASIGTQSLTVSGAAAGPQTSYSASASTGGNGNYYYYGQPLNLSLSANTLLLIDANVALSASASNPQACSYYYCNQTESATASASLFLSYNYSGTGVSNSYNANQSLSLSAAARGEYTSYGNYQYNPETGYYEYIYSTVPKLEENKSLSDVLSGVFTNSSNTTQLASLGLSVSVSGSANTVPDAGALVVGGDAGTSISAVPESSSFAMGLAGLGVVGMMLRRRRQQ